MATFILWIIAISRKVKTLYLFNCKDISHITINKATIDMTVTKDLKSPKPKNPRFVDMLIFRNWVPLHTRQISVYLGNPTDFWRGIPMRNRDREMRKVRTEQQKRGETGCLAKICGGKANGRRGGSVWGGRKVWGGGEGKLRGWERTQRFEGKCQAKERGREERREFRGWMKESEVGWEVLLDG